MKFYQHIKTIPWSADGRTGRDLDLSVIPQAINGQPVYVESLTAKVQLTLSNADAVNDYTFSHEYEVVSRAVSHLRLNHSWLGKDQINVDVIDFLRVLRASYRGGKIVEGIFSSGNTVVPKSGSVDVAFTLPVDFRRPYARRSRDYHMPARLLSASTFELKFGRFDITDISVSAATVEVYAVCSTRGSAELALPSIVCVESQPVAAGVTQPTINRYNGALLTLVVGRQGAAGFANSEFNTLGWRVGNRPVSDDSTSVSAYYDDFAMSAFSSSFDGFTDHTSGSAAADDAIPLVFPSVGLEGQRLTAAIDLNADQRLVTNVTTNPYVLTHMRVEHAGAWVANAARILGVDPARLVSQTASHKGLAAGASAARSVLPRKAR